MQATKTDRFPIDWDEWREQWEEWREAHAADLQPTKTRFRGKNFLADEVLGTWDIHGRTVELSEVTFPNLEERDESGRLIDKRVRSVGITFAVGAGIGDDTGDVVSTFADLEKALGL